jgi:hypothetical protein
VRRNRARVTNGARVLAEVEGVTTVVADSGSRTNRHWSVTFEDGTVWRIERAGGCNCR